MTEEDREPQQPSHSHVIARSPKGDAAFRALVPTSSELASLGHLPLKGKALGTGVRIATASVRTGFAMTEKDRQPQQPSHSHVIARSPKGDAAIRIPRPKNVPPSPPGRSPMKWVIPGKRRGGVWVKRGIHPSLNGTPRTRSRDAAILFPPSSPELQTPFCDKMQKAFGARDFRIRFLAILRYRSRADRIDRVGRLWYNSLRLGYHFYLRRRLPGPGKSLT